QLLMHKSLLEQVRDPFNSDDADLRFIRLHLRFLDMHYYAVCIDKIHKLYPKILGRLSQLTRGAPNIAEIRTKKMLAEHHLRLSLAPVTEARKYLEHIDKEIAANSFDGLQTKTSQAGATFTFGKDKNQVTVDIGNLEQVKKAYEALIGYIGTLPDA